MCSILHNVNLKKYLTNEVALKIYKTMILPYIDYADVIYCKARIGDLDTLQRLQNRCLKMYQGGIGFLAQTGHIKMQGLLSWLTDGRPIP